MKKKDGNEIKIPKTKKQKLNLKHKKLIGIIILLVLVIVVIFALTRKKEKVEVKKEETKKVETKDSLSVYDVNSKERPVAVMMPNDGIAKKRHYGLQKAYMVYEITVEGGITRLMALFKDVNVEKIGPVRSSRHYYLDYALESDAIYVHFGWSPQAQEDIPALGVNNLNGIYNPSNMFWRDKNYSAPNNAFTSTENIKKAASKSKYRLTSDNYEVLKYAKEIDLNSDATVKNANKVTVNYENNCFVLYEYDATNKYYLRTNNSTKDIDLSTNEQIHVKNILVLKIANTNISNDEKGRQSLSNIGTGEGYYITNGQIINITWNKSERTGKTIYKNSNGEEIKVSDGNTYIQIIPINKTISVE